MSYSDLNLQLLTLHITFAQRRPNVSTLVQHMIVQMLCNCFVFTGQDRPINPLNARFAK